jgi:hypothetical protein
MGCRKCGGPMDESYPGTRVCKSCYIAKVVEWQDRQKKGREIIRETSCKYCPKCYGQSWRRPRGRLCRCGEAYAPCPKPVLDPFARVGDPVEAHLPRMK